MFMRSTHSNRRELSMEELLLALMAAKIPAFLGEPKEITKLRREGEAALATANHFPGAILDALVFEYLKFSGKLHE